MIEKSTYVTSPGGENIAGAEDLSDDGDGDEDFPDGLGVHRAGKGEGFSRSKNHPPL